MPKGKIKKLVADRGFGFIQPQQGQDIFFHNTEVQDADFVTLREGQEVEFEVGRGRDGRTRAVKVRIVRV